MSLDAFYDVKIVRLQSGDDIVANLIIDENDYILENPMILVFKRTSEGTMMLMAPWLPIELLKEDLAIINAKDVLTVVDPKEPVVDYYYSVVETLQKTVETRSKDLMDILFSNEEEPEIESNTNFILH